MPKPYNFIFFQSDNHNRDLLGCYGDPLVKTPNLDRIAQNGVRFTNAYAASALCCPARASIATGRFHTKPVSGIMRLFMTEVFLVGCIASVKVDVKWFQSGNCIIEEAKMTMDFPRKSCRCTSSIKKEG